MASKSEILAAKRLPRVTEEWDEVLQEWTWVKRTIPSGPHAPNKNEAKLLRRLMSQTSLNEEQIRQHKIYRQKLAQARLAGGPGKTPAQRYALRLRKQILRELKLPKEHEAVKAEFLLRLKDFHRYFWPSPTHMWESILRL